MKKFILALAVALVLCVPAFADNVSFFSASPFSYTDYIYDGFCEQTDSSQPVYFYAIDDGSVSAISESSNAPFRCGRVQKGTGNLPNYTNLVCSNAVGDYYGNSCFTIQRSIESTNPLLSVFPSGTTNADISAAFTDFLNNLPTPEPSVASSFTLPRGNVLYFQVESEQDVHFTSYMDSLSNIINFNSVTYGAWGDTGQRYGEAAALPNAGTVFPLLSQSPIAWQKDSSTNILGQTKVGLATKHCIVGQWYCLYNPNANHVEGADPYNASPGASVVVQGAFSQIKVYPVNQKLSVVDGDLYSGSNDDFDSYYDGTIDQDGTVTWTNQDGNIEAPAAGGQNFEDGPKSATSLLEGIRVTLETVVHELQTLFTFGYSAIQSLVGIMSDFVSVFSGLYTWLPAEVYSALMSAVVVAIVIGVFKVFL